MSYSVCKGYIFDHNSLSNYTEVGRLRGNHVIPFLFFFVSSNYGISTIEVMCLRFYVYAVEHHLVLCKI
jgi:hypothetical protein